VNGDFLPHACTAAWKRARCLRERERRSPLSPLDKQLDHRKYHHLEKSNAYITTLVPRSYHQHNPRIILRSIRPIRDSPALTDCLAAMPKQTTSTALGPVQSIAEVVSVMDQHGQVVHNGVRPPCPPLPAISPPYPRTNAAPEQNLLLRAPRSQSRLSCT
jgi:hypothetical protein